ncbi:hypothetical protein PINS_up015222 [Pythium insidiosum]|nr:hypothetical protein PINS_up015222 [Pythium insidiosum]
MLELALRAGIGSILSTPQWWRQWLPTKRSLDGTTAVHSAREHRLDAIADVVLDDRVEMITLGWRCRFGDCFAADCRKLQLQHLVGFPWGDEEDADERRAAFFDDERTTIAYEMAVLDQIQPCTDDPAHAVELRAMLASCQFFSDARLRALVEEIDSTAFICWYFAVLVVGREVRGTFEWPDHIRSHDMLPLEGGEAGTRAARLICAASKRSVTRDSFAAQYPDADARPEAIDLLWFHVDRAVRQLESVRACAGSTLDSFIDRHDLLNPMRAAERFGFISPGPAMETWMSDSIIPPALQTFFQRAIAELENVPDEFKDWRPWSNGQLLDLVHPSLFCSVLGETRRLPQNQPLFQDNASAAESMYRSLFMGSTPVVNLSSRRYQWIPTDFRVDADGRVKISSYINNLHPVHHRELYDAIENIFERFVPLFDRVLSSLAKPTDPEPLLFPDARDDITLVPLFPELPPRLTLEDEAEVSYTIKGTIVQVITKISAIYLTPENPRYPGGSWHLQGSENERVVATGLYFFDSDNVTDSTLSLRVLAQPPDLDEDDLLGGVVLYGKHLVSFMQKLDTITAIEGRCLVLPSMFELKVDPVELVDRSRYGVRKLLTFLVVDPSQQIASTSVIPPQQEHWRQEILQELKKTRLPEGVVQGPLAEMLGCGMRWKEADRHRHEDMEQRGLVRPDPWAFSLDA